MTSRSGGLKWTQPKWNKSRYELRDGTSVVGTLETTGALRTVTSATYGDQRYTIRTQGFWKSATEVCAGDSEDVLARCVLKGRVWNVEFTAGRTFVLRRHGFWSTSWEFAAPDNEIIVALSNDNRWFRSGANVVLSANAPRYPETPILVVLGWYVMLEAAHQAAAAAT